MPTAAEQVRGAVLEVLDKWLGDEAFGGRSLVSPGLRTLITDELLRVLGGDRRGPTLAWLSDLAGLRGPSPDPLVGQVAGHLAPESIRCPDCGRPVDRAEAQGGCLCRVQPTTGAGN